LSSLGLVQESIAGGIPEAQNAEEDKADQAGAADIPAVDEARTEAGPLAMLEVRIAGEAVGPAQDQKEPAG
jgi:hypothetical protein